ncbi:MAG: iron-sulfur cluster assembly protein [Candidatus Bostrichicola ureolyticus]|nr:MAG: iron-sulfur cluster assembly protein [Candidatus Bostrichicola ureolyticus]
MLSNINKDLYNNIISVLKTIYDPEIQINIYELGLIYDIDIINNDNIDIKITMTLTSPNCPIADSFLTEIKNKINNINGINNVIINLIFEPKWNKEMMSEEAKLELGLL